MPRRRQTIVLGLELGDGTLLRSWAQQGLLPVLRQLIDTGSWAWLETTADQLHISAWPTLYTGSVPGEHGVYFTFQPAPGVQGYQRFHEGIYGRPTFWKLLDEAGITTAVLDAPYTHPESSYRGIHVYDWGTWAHYLSPGSVPPIVLQQLERACGRYPLGLEANNLGLDALDPVSCAERLIAAIRAKAAAIGWLSKEHPSDLVFAVFGETHVAGHYCWSSGEADGQRPSATSPMLRVYQELDQAIGQIRQSFGADATLLIVSGDRVGANHAGWHLLPDVLARLGLFADRSLQPQLQSDPQGGAPFDPVKFVRDLLPVDLRKWLARRLPTALRDRLAQRVDSAEIDWSRTRAFCLPTDLEGYVRVNLRGREPLGIVEPGSEYTQVLAEIERALWELRDPRTQQAVVREVIRTDERFPGSRRAFLPDLIVCWNSASPIVEVHSERLGSISRVSPDARTGTHIGPGFALATGPGVPQGAMLEGAHILDFAPTVLASFGVAVPAHMPGRVWSEITTGS